MRRHCPFGDVGCQIRDPEAGAAHAAGLHVLCDLRTLPDVSGRHSQWRVQYPRARRAQPGHQAARQDRVQFQGLYGRAFCRNDRMESEGDRGDQNGGMRRALRNLPGRVDALMAQDGATLALVKAMPLASVPTAVRTAITTATDPATTASASP